MPNALFLGSSLYLDRVLHATLIEGECWHSRLSFTANSLRVVNVLWYASTTVVHGRDCQNTEDKSSSWDCQNTAIVVGEFATEELRPYIYPRNIIHNVFLRSATISLFFFEMVGLVSAHLLTPHIG